MSTRDEYRRRLIGSTIQRQSRVVDVFGLTIELRQQSLDDILGTGAVERTTKEQVAHTLIGMAYIPGTEERIFEAGDFPQLMQWPFGPDYMRLQTAMNELMGVDIEKEEKALEQDPLAKSS